ncbi:MAG: hypothetical protein KatS3mg100_033 [Candidatus Parcubacteria bacterium]|nr:MAG: hypothetical protein KatS3mg100_033 [Candidatus Parcubacteria bacterium]
MAKKVVKELKLQIPAGESDARAACWASVGAGRHQHWRVC